MTTQAEIPEEERVFLTYLRAKDFRSLHNLQLDIGSKLTVLAGPNASGKSNIVDAMSFVVDALYDGVDRAVGYRRSRAILHRHRGKSSRSFLLGLGLESCKFTAHHEFKIGIQRGGEVSILAERIFGETKSPTKSKFNFSLKDGKFLSSGHANLSNTLTKLKYPSDTLMLSVMGDSPIVANLLTSSLMSLSQKSELAMGMSSGVPLKRHQGGRY